MERKELINAIIDFCIEYRVFIKLNSTDEIKIKIENGLNDMEFIENLINTIILKARNSKNIDIDKIKNLLLELEKIRLELEY